MAEVKQTIPGVYEFENQNAIKKKTVRGLFRKRAKNYDSQSEEGASDEDAAGAGLKRGQKVVKKTMSAAFKMIMRKNIPNEDGTAVWEHVKGDAPKAKGETILAKYKKKARDLDEQKVKDDAEKKKVLDKEK